MLVAKDEIVSAVPAAEHSRRQMLEADPLVGPLGRLGHRIGAQPAVGAIPSEKLRHHRALPF